MADQLTKQQEQAVYNRGGNLLVSAAAGSGKTKVLVDRLLSYLMQPQDPANVDDFLIITYTKAAAAELRGKIAAKLTERIAEDPDNRHLQRQLQRLYLAKISTVHAFCGDLLREYAYRLDLAADFRVADEMECAALRESVLSRILEEAYERAGEDADFRAFVDSQGLGRDDRLVPEIVQKVYDSARCHLDPEQWLQNCVRSAQAEGIDDAAQTIWGAFLMESLKSYLELQIRTMERCAQQADATDTMEKQAQLLHQTVAQLRYLQESATWDDVIQRKQIDYGRLVFSKKCPDLVLAEQIKSVRAACKKNLDKKLRLFSESSQQVMEDLQQIAPAVRGLIALVGQFDREYHRAKKARRILDFGDLEHGTLDLLLGKQRTGVTSVAREISHRFREIMVDEYQDSNGVQDAIFSALTEEKHNCFMVGDVKQSIYQFRLADPGIFLKKYNTYPSVEEAQPGEGRKVLLSKNFRSSGGVLAGANDVFRYCMSPEVGGLNYGEEEALQEGICHVPLGEPEVELLAVDVQDSTYPEEAAAVAHRIRQLLSGNHFVRQGDSLRRIRPEDIAILLRSPGSMGVYFRDALAQQGLRCVSGSGDDLLQTQEVATLRAILQTVANPRQDIPLIAALASPVFGFTAEDLAAFRSKNRRGCVYEALCAWEDPKAKAFLETLQQLRHCARMMPLAQLLEELFARTQLDRIYGAMADGESRCANLQDFYTLAVEFEATGRRDLQQFLDFLDGVEVSGLATAGEQSAAGAVTLMSIHKSKGLEFPVVIVAGLSREFSRESVRAQVLCHRELGLGLTAVDAKNRVRFPTIAKRAIALKTTMDGVSEELRVLYVALTRARDRLVMTYASDALDSDLSDLANRMPLSERTLMTADVHCPGQWVLMAALRRSEAGSLFALGGNPGVASVSEMPWNIRVVTASADDAVQQQIQEAPEFDARWIETLRQSLSFRYDHLASTEAPSKQTATQRKGRDKDAEAAEQAPQPKFAHIWRKPGFREGQAQGKEYGTAIHTLMQYIRYEACADEAGVRGELQRLVAEKYLTPEQAQKVLPQEIAAFFATPLGQKLRSGGEVLREFKFSILDHGEDYDPELSGEQILLQGVVDCALVEPDGITIVDFKTDFVTNATVLERAAHYRPQVQAYANALSRIYQKPVKQALLYFFRLGEFVSVDL